MALKVTTKIVVTETTMADAPSRQQQRAGDIYANEA